MKSKDARICIVGAGPAGLSAAYALKTRGYTNVVVLEAQERVGGKCRTIDFNGRSFDVGANYVTAAYSEVRKLARSFGATLYTEAAATTARMSPSGEMTFRTPLKAITQNGSLLAFFKAALRYSLIRFHLRAVVDPPGFDRLSRHPEICVSFRDWLKANKLSALEPMFEVPITIMGYGYLDEIPAPYALKYLSLPTYWNLIAVALGLPRRWPKRFVDGFQRLWEQVGAMLDVRLGVRIERIDRRGPIRVHLSTNETLEFDHLILACPLFVETLEGFLELSVGERDLFKRVIAHEYVVTTYVLPGLRLPKRIVGMVPVPQMGQPWALTQQFADSDLVQFYTRLNRGYPESQESVIAEVRHWTNALGVALPATFVTYDAWSYFPHVAAQDIRSGFYDRFEALQGQSCTYYCGSLAAFELVETVVRYSRRLVETHF